MTRANGDPYWTALLEVGTLAAADDVELAAEELADEEELVVEL